MKNVLRAFVLVLVAGTPFAASAQGYGSRRVPADRDLDAAGSLSGRAPWQERWQYDSGSDQDRHPELPYYQQGHGQETGGPARNLIPGDNLHLFPRR